MFYLIKGENKERDKFNTKIIRKKNEKELRFAKEYYFHRERDKFISKITLR